MLARYILSLFVFGVVCVILHSAILVERQLVTDGWTMDLAMFTHSVSGYNSAESKPIWMKSGAFCVHCCTFGLALADFGHDPRSSNSLTSRQNFFRVYNAQFH